MANYGTTATPKDKRPMVLIVILLVLVAVLAVCLVVALTGGFSPSKYNVCTEKQCIELSNSILSSMDDSISPCEDFYQFTCGRYSHHNLQDSDGGPQNVLEEIQERLVDKLDGILTNINRYQKVLPAVLKAANLYLSCPYRKGGPINNTLANQVIEGLDVIGGWPLMEGPNYKAEDVWNIILPQALRKYGRSGILSVSVELDVLNTTRNVITISSGDYKNSLANLENYSLQKYLLHHNIKGKKVEEDLYGMLYIYRTLQQIEPTENEIDELVANRTTYVTIKDLNKQIPGVDLVKLLSTVLEEDPSKPTLNINNRDVVSALSAKYLRIIAKLISTKTVSPRALANVVGWDIFNSLIHLEDVYNPAHRLSEGSAINGRYRCLSVVTENMGLAADYAYYILDQQEKQLNLEQSTTMLDYIKLALSEAIRENNWIDPQTRENIQKKLVQMNLINGYSEQLKDTEMLREKYEELGPISSDYLKNMETLVKYQRSQLGKRLRSPANRTEISESGLITNLLYIRTANTIVVPGALQTAPLYHPKVPMYANFGGLGAMMGHEVIHGYDGANQNYDNKGLYNPTYIMPDSKMAYSERKSCLLGQIEALTIKGEGVISINTVEENLADLSGLKQAFYGYRRYIGEKGSDKLLPGLSKYNTDQLFFIAYGASMCGYHSDVYINGSNYSPLKYRTNSAVSNFDIYGKAFQCKDGDPMMREMRCEIW